MSSFVADKGHFVADASVAFLESHLLLSAADKLLQTLFWSLARYVPDLKAPVAGYELCLKLLLPDAGDELFCSLLLATSSVSFILNLISAVSSARCCLLR